MILDSCECMSCYTYERFLLQGNEIRFDIVIDFNCDNRKALYQDILKNAQNHYLEYPFNTILGCDIHD